MKDRISDVNKTMPEEMEAFFDCRFSGYEEHMKNTVADFDRFYHKVTDMVGKEEETLNILDLGCGTGLELERLLQKPNIGCIKCIDLSEKMLSILIQKFRKHEDKLFLIKGSYLDIPFEEKEYHYVISVMTAHHFLQDTKAELYRKIRKALRRGGLYIEGDYIVSPEKEKEFLSSYYNACERMGIVEAGKYHIDIPFSLDTQIRLLMSAGFESVEVVWIKEEDGILVAKV